MWELQLFLGKHMRVNVRVIMHLSFSGKTMFFISCLFAIYVYVYICICIYIYVSFLLSFSYVVSFLEKWIFFTFWIISSMSLTIFLRISGHFQKFHPSSCMSVDFEVISTPLYLFSSISKKKKTE